ncbi:related to histone acetyltransferase [Melanopsichium pennsylvanicum]|uniref:histone acetyltransferase n=2 Tax=Melanopsichium pennsylvanicum TaxID=63383 RepID=A0AAJ5C3G1_9BASI|nr:related to histone acetyltransferase [Melanopsichium pennsylvanicum 4]SNX82590.1 related to histone acetyltransferase [Melanopsichium pennsylvanicum]
MLSSIDQHAMLPVGAVCEVIDPNTGTTYTATVLSRRSGSSSNPPPGFDSDIVQYYVHRHDQDKRMDDWVDRAFIRPASISDGNVSPSLLLSTQIRGANGSFSTMSHSIGKGKRKADHDLAHEGGDGSRTPSISRPVSPALPDRGATHRRRQEKSAGEPDTPALRNIDRVLYGSFDIKTWYYSPYPLDHDDEDGSAAHSSASASSLGANKRHQSPASLKSGAAATTAKRAARKDSTSTSSLTGALSTSSQHAPAIKALSADLTNRASPTSSNSLNARSKKDSVPTQMLWICDGCFKYMKTYNAYSSHRKFCPHTHPPGRKVYQRGAHIIWEVDGAQQKLYCQNLSLFGKLFIDHKTIYFDVEPFMFYVLTDAANASFDHPLGFFSKEKVSYDDYNLACIVTFPPFQRKSFGTLMIEFSYYLSGKGGMLGTPERPLSDLGFKGYLSFWTAVLMRVLIESFDGPLRKPKTGNARHRRASSAVKPDAIGNVEEADLRAKAQDALRRWRILNARCKLLNISLERISHQSGFSELQRLASEAESSEAPTSSSSTTAKRKLRLKGWAGSAPSRSPWQQLGSAPVGNESTTRRSSRVALNVADIAEENKHQAAIHPALDIAKLQDDAEITMAVPLESLSRLTCLRLDDIVLALTEAGLVDGATNPHLPVSDEAIPQNSPHACNGTDQGKERKSATAKSANPNLALVLTRQAIREIITRFNIRPPVLDESFALI